MEAGNPPDTLDESIYRNLFEFSPTPAALFDEDGRCLLANRAFFIQLDLDHTRPDLQTISIASIFANPADSEALASQIRERGAARRVETQLLTGGGEPFSALVSGRTVAHHGTVGRAAIEIAFTNIAHQKGLERALRSRHMRLAALIENLAAGTFLVNNQGRVTEANMAFGNLLGVAPEDFVNRSYQHLFAHLIAGAADPEILQRELSRAVLNVREHPVVEFVLNEGRPQNLELTLFAVRSEEGYPLGWGGLLSDITEMRAQTAWKLELLSVLSHDIRSPLATLKGHATALLANHEHWDSAMVTEFLEAINRGVDQLAHQVDRNLALTRVEAGRLGLRPEHARPDRLVALALERAAGPLEDVDVALDFDDELPAVRADPGRVEEVLVNLLENAARYTPADEAIVVRVRGEDNWVVFSVIDRGPGVPKPLQNRIFDKYVRGEAEGGGTGLGLYISRKIVEAHGGSFRLRSPLEPGTPGAAFSFTLPVMPEIQAEPPATARQAASIPKDIETTDQRILVVEDESDMQTLLRTILQEEGYEVELAPDGPTALDIVRVSPPDLVLLDWVLPGPSGLQTCRSLRRYSSVPVVMLTSRTAPEDLLAAFDAGADDYLTKPFPRDELLVRIRALLRRRPANETESQTNSFSAGGLTIDFDTRDAWLNGEQLDLTATEFDLLAAFARHPRQVLTYDQLIDSIWPDGDGTRRGLFVHVSRLRSKIEADPKQPKFIATRWGVGYVFLP